MSEAMMGGAPEPGRRRARVLHTKRGKFVHVGDFQAALLDEAFVLECAAMIKIAHELKHPPLMGVKMAVLHALTELAGPEQAPSTNLQAPENQQNPSSN